MRDIVKVVLHSWELKVVLYTTCVSVSIEWFYQARQTLATFTTNLEHSPGIRGVAMVWSD